MISDKFTLKFYHASSETSFNVWVQGGSVLYCEPVSGKVYAWVVWCYELCSCVEQTGAILNLENIDQA